MFADVMPPEPTPTLEVMSERSACESALTEPERFLVSSGVRSMTSRRSASSSFTWFSCFWAFLRASSFRSTGGGFTIATFGSILGFSFSLATGGGGGGLGLFSSMTRARRSGTSHSQISYAVFCLKKKINKIVRHVAELYNQIDDT